MKSEKKIERLVLSVLFLSIIWEIIVFIFAPKQAYVLGLLESWYFKNGLLFYKDMANAYTPLLNFIMYAYHELFGYGLNQTILLAPIVSIANLVILYLVGRKWLSGLSRIAPLIFYEIWAGYLGANSFTTTSFLGILILISFIYWLGWLKKPQKTLSFVLGLLFSFSVLTIQIVAPFIAVLSLAVLVKSIKLKKIIYFIYLCLGIIIPVGILFYWVWANNIVNEFLYWNILYYFDGYPYSGLTKDVSMVAAFVAIHSTILVYSLGAPRDEDRIQYVYTILSILVIALTFWFSVFHPFRFQISLPLMSLILGMGIERYLSGKRSKLKNFILGVALGATVLCSILYIIPRYFISLSFKNVGRIISEVYPGDLMFDTVEWVKSNTPINSKIFLLGDTYFYFVAKRLPANYRNALGNEQMLFFPLNKLQEELMANRPDYWVIDERLYLTYSNWNKNNLSVTIKKFLSCQTEIKKFDYWIVAKLNSSTEACVSRLKFQ